MVNTIVRFLNEYLIKSLYLDFLTLKTDSLAISEKIDLISKKYFLIFKHLVFKKKFELRSSKILIFGKLFCYDSKFGLAGFQTTFTGVYNHLCFLKKFKRNSKLIIFDVGANVGNFTYFMKHVFKNSILYSFEPIPEIFDCLKNNTRELTDTQIFNYAISDKNGQATMSFNSDMGYVSRFTENRLSQNVAVETKTLDSLFTDFKIKHIDILKIDVETFENLVLNGAQNILQNVHYLMVEVTIKDNINYTSSELFSKLVGKGFNFNIISINSYGGDLERVELFDCILENVLYTDKK